MVVRSLYISIFLALYAVGDRTSTDCCTISFRDDEFPPSRPKAESICSQTATNEREMRICLASSSKHKRTFTLALVHLRVKATCQIPATNEIQGKAVYSHTLLATDDCLM